MALANVAFIAALNGCRVLVMDWDLEAPGLHQYFRGLMEPAEVKAFRAAPGILDLAWEWVQNVRQLREADQVDDLVSPFLTGQKFDEAICSLIEEDALSEDGRLDILRAGRETISCPEPKSYAEALSDFDWSAFFRFDVGGLLLNSLREWAKRNYDYVLIDSRTGLADVAGVCTMQLPDDVALCFVLNRQNMEGVARVAHAIRSKRSEEIKLRVVPMRLASRGTSEEADARARAKRLMTKTGHFSPEEFEDDYKALAVQAAANVPFYETLAPIVAGLNASQDPLSLDYLRIASKLLGRPFNMPELDEDWVRRVRRRAQSRVATADYLEELKSSVPERAFEEVSGLVDAALDTLLDNEDELDGGYVEALVHTAFEVAQESDEDPFDVLAMFQQTAEMLRHLASGSGTKMWRVLLIEALGHILEMSGYLEPEEELSLLEEIDGLLSEDPTHAAQLQRLWHRRRAARLLIGEQDYEGAEQLVVDIAELASALADAELAADQLINVQLAQAEIFILRGDIQFGNGDTAGARKEFEKALTTVREFDRKERQSELSRPRFDAHLRLATRIESLSARSRAMHALEAARWGTQLGIVHSILAALTDVIVSADDPQQTLDFVTLIYLGERSAQLLSYSSRLPRTGVAFFGSTAKIVDSLSRLKDGAAARSAIEDLARMSASVARSLTRRKMMVPPLHAQQLKVSVEELVDAFRRSDIEPEGLGELVSAMAEVRPRTSGIRRPPPRPSRG